MPNLASESKFLERRKRPIHPIHRPPKFPSDLISLQIFKCLVPLLVSFPALTVVRFVLCLHTLQRFNPSTLLTFHFLTLSTFSTLISRGQRRAKVPDLVLNVRGIFDGMRDFIAQQRPITLPHYVQLFFYGSLGHSQSRGEFGVG